MSHNGLFATPMHFDMALQPACFYMLHKGMRIDKEKQKELSEKYHNEINDLYVSLDQVVGYPLKANKAISDDRIKKWLYGKMGVKTRMKNKKVTSNEDALRAILAEEVEKINSLKTEAARHQHLVIAIAIKLILRIKEREKRLGTYIDVLFDDDSPSIRRARCSITVGGAETGRFSHSGTPWGTGTNSATFPREVRSIIIPDEGMELAEFDLHRGESWIYAFLSNDPELIRIHMEDADFHSETASAISAAFSNRSYSLDEIVSLYKSGDNFGYKIRYLGKRTNHASAYRMGPFKGAEIINGESDDTGITVVVKQVKKAQKLWQEKYYMIPRWWESIERQIKDTRTLETPYGRKRVFYHHFNDEKLYKEATAYVPQSTSVDYLNLGMLQVFNKLVLKGFCELLHQQHDSIVIQYPIDKRDEVLPTVREHLLSKLIVNRHEISIPVEASYGMNWKDLEGYKK